MSVECRSDRPYKRLILAIHGEEYLNYTQHYFILTVGIPITNDVKRQTYNESVSFCEFPDGIKSGQYSYPFQFLLSPNLPASFLFEKGNYEAYIKYHVAAIFPEAGGSDTQEFRRELNIR